MIILVFNCGSSSLNYKVFASTGSEVLCVLRRGKAHRVGVHGSEPAFIEHYDPAGHLSRLTTPIPDHATAARLVLRHLREMEQQVQAVGHRFVHGGSDFQRSTLLTDESMARLQRTLPLAPIHNPNSLAVIRVCQAELPDLPEYLTFDTAFHAGLPPEAYTYALPQDIAQTYHLRKYGFHGLSYQYVTAQAAQFLDRPLADLRLVACHLGTGGSSAVAVDRGRPLDTTMGYSPLAGLMMSTRTGDMDALLPATLMSSFGYSPQALTSLFNTKSGLLGVSGFSSDIRDLIHAMDDESEPRAHLAFAMY
ncbi:MAG: acetate kinase, partial [Anaerolineaceae bacterium]|nr:acetate kinase [Anaerolineaceae bacterium]